MAAEVKAPNLLCEYFALEGEMIEFKKNCRIYDGTTKTFICKGCNDEWTVEEEGCSGECFTSVYDEYHRKMSVLMTQIRSASAKCPEAVNQILLKEKAKASFQAYMIKIEYEKREERSMSRIRREAASNQHRVSNILSHLQKLPPTPIGPRLRPYILSPELPPSEMCMIPESIKKA